MELLQSKEVSLFWITVTGHSEKNSESFRMAAEYAELKGTTDYNVLPEAGRSLSDQAFDSTKDTQEIQVHPSDPKKMTFIASNLDIA